MRRYSLALVLAGVALAIFVVVVPEARRERDAAREQHAQAREERERLRVRLADLSRRTTGDQGATAADGLTAARGLRLALLRATDGLEVTGVEIQVSPLGRGSIAASGRFAAEGRFAVVLRLARRLARPSSGLLLQRVSLGEARSGVRLEAPAFILEGKGSRSPAATSKARPAPTDSDLLEIRDIFRYADEPRVAATLPGRPADSQGTALSDDATPQPARARLIGLVQRSSRHVAAVIIDGEVLLLAEGESALGFTVLDIREEAVRLRDPEGNEETLELP